ncbi:MAG TPA: phosphonate ABC transporter, permease protein PhnE, partial [Brevundimonas sp.]|nr:phosphonate ABC transporter, permease protein PhnE [Brevundimonas sp.]
MTDAVASGAATIPAPPVKSAGAWALDVLIWGGVAILLATSFGAVDLAKLGRLFTNSANIQNFGSELLRPDFTNWRLFVEKMWETVQIALWGTFLAIFIAVPMGLA